MYNINFPCKFHDNQAKFVFTKHGYRTYENGFKPIFYQMALQPIVCKAELKILVTMKLLTFTLLTKVLFLITPLQIERTDFNKLTQIKNFGGTLNGIND